MKAQLVTCRLWRRYIMGVAVTANCAGNNPALGGHGEQ